MPTLSILVATALALVAAFPAVACSPVGSPIFKPEKSNVVLHTDSKTGYVLHPPAPIVRAATVHRGTGSDGVSCADAGSLTVDLALPSDSPYSPNELGFYFRVIEGENVLAGYSIPLSPFSVSGNFGKYTMYWLDGAPSQQRALDLVVEVFALANNLEIGPATRFKVKSGVGR